METIFKYELTVDDRQRIDMPIGAEILCVQVQNDKPCLWAKVDPTREYRAREILTYGTGHQIKHTDLSYIGSYQLGNGRLVFHVFEINF